MVQIHGDIFVTRCSRCEFEHEHGGVEHDAPCDLEEHRGLVPHGDDVPHAPEAGRALSGIDLERPLTPTLERVSCPHMAIVLEEMADLPRALVSDAKVMILDEPTATLAPPEVDRLFGTLRRLRESGLGIIYISHRLDEIFSIADRITVLRDGRHIVTARAEGINRRELIRAMVGRDVDVLVDSASHRFHTWFVQGDYVILPPLQASLRYENLSPADPEAARIRALDAALSFFVYANVKTMVEYRRDLSESKNYQLSAILRFAF